MLENTQEYSKETIINIIKPIIIKISHFKYEPIKAMAIPII